MSGPDPRAETILAVLRECPQPAPTCDIAERLGIEDDDVRAILFELEGEGLVSFAQFCGWRVT